MKYKVNFEIDFKRNPYDGKLIALEGMDASGKTTQAEKLFEVLKAQGKKVYLTKEPTREGEIGGLIHRILQKEVMIPSAAIQYLYSADREVQQAELVEHLKNGEIVITDRYFWSSVPYGLADQKDLSIDDGAKMILVAQSVLSHYHGFIVPDYTFLLEISVDEVMERLSKMKKNKEIYEERDVIERVKKGYDWIANEFKDEIILINGSKRESEIAEEILNKLSL
jgi:dTMP kinase